MTVVYFGPLTCSIITTTRKFFTILASVILFANPISSMQWVGTVLVFLGECHPYPNQCLWATQRDRDRDRMLLFRLPPENQHVHL